MTTAAAPSGTEGLENPHDIEVSVPAPHPRKIGWVGTTALAMGGSNQMLFLIGALIVGQGDIPGQGSAAIPLLMVGLLLSWAAAPGWMELVLMFPKRVGGISATCAEAFRPYSAVLSNLTGVCYWWGWVPTCGLTALLSASAINQWYLPSAPVPLLACGIVLLFTGVNLAGVQWATRLAVPIATASASLAILSAVIPVVTGNVDWQQATTFHLTVPFPGVFGQITSAMAGLYIIGFAAPAFEQSLSHVGETIDPERNVPRAMLASALMAGLYFVVLPVVWLGALGPEPLGRDLAQELGPTFAPLLGGAARAAAIWFMTFNMFHGTLAPLAGAARVLAQLSEDGLLPRMLAWRTRTDAPWVATLLTASMAMLFLLAGDPLWLIAAANLTYLIGICLPNVAVWLLRRNAPDMHRPYRAPRGTIVLGLLAAGAWGVSTVLGFQQFGLPTVLAGIGFAYAGSFLYAYRVWSDRRRCGLPGVSHTLHIKLTGAMILVLVLDGAGYLIAVSNVATHETALIAMLEDIFVVVALLTISVGLILPGMIAHSAEQVSKAADRLATGTLADFSRAMQALSAGDIEAARARIDIIPVVVHTRDELGSMAASFNILQSEVGHAAIALDGAREGLRSARNELRDANTTLEHRVQERTMQVQQRTLELEKEIADRERTEVALRLSQKLESVGRLAAGLAHEINSPAQFVNDSVSFLGQAMGSLTDLITQYRGVNRSVLDEVPAAVLAREAAATEDRTDIEYLLAEVPKALETARNGIDRIASIVRAMKAFAQPGEMTIIDLNETILNVLTVTRNGYAGVADVKTLLGDIPLVSCHASELNQALLHLLENAWDAIGDVVSGTDQRGLITVETRLEHDFVVIAVHDTGGGIPDEIRDRIFDPFFTTKEIGKGAGQGLAIARAVALQGHNGDLTFQTEEGKGTTFFMRIPAGGAAASSASVAPGASSVSPHRGV